MAIFNSYVKLPEGTWFTTASHIAGFDRECADPDSEASSWCLFGPDEPVAAVHLRGGKGREQEKNVPKSGQAVALWFPFFENFKDVQTSLPKELRIAQRQRRWGGGFAHERKPFALELIHGHPGMFKETAHQGCLCRSWCAYVIMTI